MDDEELFMLIMIALAVFLSFCISLLYAWR